MEPVAYTYEADIHCPECTEKRFPKLEGVDHEGNEVGAVFSWDEILTDHRHCGDCREELVTA
jgi:hypothetical protein